MAFVDTSVDENNYLFYVAKVRALRGECTLRMSNFEDLCKVVCWLCEKDYDIEVTTGNECGQKLCKALRKNGHNVTDSKSGYCEGK